MSIVVYGPQGCGKNINAEKLRKHFKLEKVVDLEIGAYGRIDSADFKVGSTLYLTNEDPPEHLRGNSRVIGFATALRAAGGVC